MNRLVPVIALVVASLGSSSRAQATSPSGVGLGVAAGANLADAENVDLDTSFAWGFFVDIPLLDTFYITPAATVYEIDLGAGKEALTDIDLNFKFIIPLGAISLGAGVIAGLTTGLGDYEGHFGLLGYFGFKLVPNFELFALGQYKRLPTSDSVPDYNNINIFAGGMFRF